MRHFTILLAGILAVAMLPASACADGLLRCLPEAGHWARYRMSEQWEDGAEREIDITIKSLGSEIVEGQRCSWIEIVFQLPGKFTRKAFRFLTPDAHLASDPLGKALSVWVRENDEASFRNDSWNGFLPRLMLVAPPRLTNEIGQGDTEVVSYSGNELECRVISGRATVQFPHSKTISRYRLLLNSNVPFGVAGATVDATSVRHCDPDPTAECNFTRGTVEFTLTSIGRNASSVMLLPDEPGDEPTHALEPATGPVSNGKSSPGSRYPRQRNSVDPESNDSR